MRRIITGLCVLAVLTVSTIASAELKQLDNTESFKGPVETRVDELAPSLHDTLVLETRAAVEVRPAAAYTPAGEPSLIEATWAPLPYDD